MLVPENMRGQNIGILGLGKSGLAAQKSLSAAGANLFVFDDFETNIQLPNLKKIKWENWPWDQLNAMVISPGIPHLHPTPHPAAEIARSKSVEIISEVEVALRAKPKAKHIAITGTNGKSTTTALLGHALEIAGIKTAVGGNIGDPVCSLTDPGHNGMIVLELSSYQLETTPSIAPHISILLNISPDHLDRHGGMRGYVASKETIIKKTRENGVAIVGIGDNFTKNIAKSARNRGILVLDANPAIAAKSLQESIVLAGNHNAENVAAVSQALNFIGVDGRVLSQALGSYRSLPHRFETVARCGKIRFINDSKATNGSAAARALEALPNVYWIAGGLAKRDGIQATLPFLSTVKKAYLIGSAANDFAEHLSGKCFLTVSKTLKNATISAFKDASAAPEGGTILLSPAAASFDQFKNFAARGKTFSSIARELCSEHMEAGHA